MKLSKVKLHIFFIRFDQKTSSYSVRGTGLHLRSDWVTPPVDVKAIFGWKVCSMIIQGKRYLWLQMLTGCHLFLGIGACFKFSHLLLSHVSKLSPFQDTVQQNHCFIYWRNLTEALTLSKIFNWHENISQSNHMTVRRWYHWAETAFWWYCV